MDDKNEFNVFDTNGSFKTNLGLCFQLKLVSTRDEEGIDSQAQCMYSVKKIVELFF